MPLEVTVAYLSDFGTALGSAGNGNLWVDVEIALEGTGATAHYTAPNPQLKTAPGATSFVVDLKRNGVTPAVGAYTVIVSAKLKYQNGAVDPDDVVVMDFVKYTFNVNVAGGESSSTVDSSAGSTSGSFTNGGATDEETSTGSVGSVFPPEGITLVQSSTNTALDADLVITASVTGGDAAAGAYTMWIDPTEAISMDTAATFATADLYEWPDWAASSDQSTQIADNADVAVTLTSIPVKFYNAGSVFVQLTVHFRDQSAGADPDAIRARRALRALQDSEGSTGLAGGSTEMVAQIQFGSDDSGATIISSFMVVSATALSGAALFL